MFGWAIGEGLCGDAYSNPVIGTNEKAPEVDDDNPARALSEAEIAAIWNAAGDDDYGRIIKLPDWLPPGRDRQAGMGRGRTRSDFLAGGLHQKPLRFDLPITNKVREIIGPRRRRRTNLYLAGAQAGSAASQRRSGS